MPYRNDHPLPADYDPDAIAREAFAKTDADAALAGEEA